MQGGFAVAAETPVTVEDDLGGILGGASDAERNTCSPEFWDVMKDRAWMEAQREITQNANLIPRPDSVLSLSCFHSYLEGQADYQEENFPQEPDESEGQLLGGTFNEISMFLRVQLFGYNDTGLGYEALLEASALVPGTAGGDPALARGFYSYALLEILILDQLVDDVSVVGYVNLLPDYPEGDVIQNPLWAAACALSREPLDFKQTYVDDNFPPLLIGGRAEVENFPVVDATQPSFDELANLMPASVHDETDYVCNMMEQVWQRSQCYDFATRSSLDIHPPVGLPATNGVPAPNGIIGDLRPAAYEHDGFYMLEEYRDRAEIGDEDFRVVANFDPLTGSSVIQHQCEIPDDDGIPDFDALDLACFITSHGLPPYGIGGITPGPTGGTDFITSILGSLTSLSAFIPFPTEDNPIWDTAFDGANPDQDTPGGVEGINDYLDMRDGTATPICAPPIQTGFIVQATGTGNNRYIDAVCPTPGCYFVPPTSIGPLGTCTE